jgi:hypothetical protein
MEKAGAALSKGDDWQQRLSDPVKAAAAVAANTHGKAGTALGSYTQAHAVLGAANAQLIQAGAFLDAAIGGLGQRIDQLTGEAKTSPDPVKSEQALASAESRLVMVEGNKAAAEQAIGAGERAVFPKGPAFDVKPALVEQRTEAAALVKELPPPLAGPKSQPVAAVQGLNSAELVLAKTSGDIGSATVALHVAVDTVDTAKVRLETALEKARGVQREIDALEAELDTAPDPDTFRAEKKKEAQRLREDLASAKAEVKAAVPPAKP